MLKRWIFFALNLKYWEEKFKVICCLLGKKVKAEKFLPDDSERDRESKCKVGFPKLISISEQLPFKNGSFSCL